MNAARESTAVSILARVRLPSASIHALADLIAAGYGLVDALDALPRSALSSRVRQTIDAQVEELRAGGSMVAALETLGLQITASAVGSTRPDEGDHLERAIRADAEARETAEAANRRLLTHLVPFLVIAGVLAGVGLYMCFYAVPREIHKVSAMLPEGERLPEALARFDAYRRSVVTGLVTLAITLAAWLAFNVGWLGPDQLGQLLNGMRLRVPWLRGHAIHACRARLLEALLHERRVGLPANQTIRRVAAREAVPRLRGELELAARRLEAGEPWASALNGTLIETPLLRDLGSLSGRGARPETGWRTAAQAHRRGAITSLRRATIAAAVIVLVPSSAYALGLVYASTIAGAVAELEGVRIEMEQLGDEIDSLLQGEP